MDAVDEWMEWLEEDGRPECSKWIHCLGADGWGHMTLRAHKMRCLTDIVSAHGANASLFSLCLLALALSGLCQAAEKRDLRLALAPLAFTSANLDRQEYGEHQLWGGCVCG